MRIVACLRLMSNSGISRTFMRTNATLSNSSPSSLISSSSRAAAATAGVPVGADDPAPAEVTEAVRDTATAYAGGGDSRAAGDGLL
jgi:hypothetical protein